MSDDKKREKTLDELAEEAGGYVSYTPCQPLVVDADYRAMSNYCRERGIEPLDLTEEEFNMFAYDKPLVYA
ncbi:MAG: hypothetical protein FWC20_07860 [Oscillospiraceae bacterium]|nr:hypothetical protein [Oscillospiraceae bacterium]MCL2279305.1 hypothetical protein [Oscillospiraceae bacterium]